jgi:hypothetical protein
MAYGRFGFSILFLAGVTGKYVTSAGTGGTGV